MPRFMYIYGDRTQTKPENGQETQIQVEEICPKIEELPENKKSVKSSKRYGGSFLGDIIFCILITIMWTSVFISFSNFGALHAQKRDSLQDYLYLGCFVALMIVALFDVYYQHLLVKSARAPPKLYLLNNKRPKNYILRIRIANGGEKEFIETEIEESQLNYDFLLETCCKELGVEKQKVVRIRKFPDSLWCTLVRRNDDVKRFRKVEYLELVVF